MSFSEIIILSGPPGAGKSTTAAGLGSTFPRSVHLHTDDFWHYIVSGGIPPFLPDSDEQNQLVMKVIRAAAFTYAAGGFVVIIDGIIGPWMLHHFRDHEKARDLPRLHYVVLRPSREETLRRARSRPAPDALVDEEPIASLWDQFSNLGEWEGHVIDATSQTSSETLAAVRRAVEGDLFLVRPAAPRRDA